MNTAIAHRPFSERTPRELAFLYWSKLGAPLSRVAAATHSSVDDVARALERLGNLFEHEPAIGRIAGYPSDTPWPERHVNTIIRRALARPDETQAVIVASEGTLTTGDLRRSVAIVCAGLATSGVGPGVRVAVDASQRIESYLVALATLLLGGTVVRLSLADGARGVQAALSAAPSRLTFTSCSADLSGFAPAGIILGLSRSGQNDSEFATWLGSFDSDATLPEVPIQPDDIALIGFTSGSTGHPKCILTSHGAVFRSSEAMQMLFRFQPDDIFSTSTDFSALSGFRSMVTMPFLSGGRLLLPTAEARQDPIALARDCAAYGVTQLTAVPIVLRSLAKAHHRLPPLAGLRRAFSGSGILDQSTRDAFAAAFNVPVIDYYASREFGTAAYSLEGSNRTITSGGGQICDALVLVADDNGNVAPPDSTGEIMVHSDCLTSSELAGTHPDWAGWHASGDLGCIKADGTLQVMGRKRDIIKASDGSMVFPAEIESLINALPSIKESCVFGVISKTGAEHIVAAVIPAAGTGDLETDIRQHILLRAGKHRVPSKVFSVPDFPRVASRKVDKAALRQQFAADLHKLVGSP